MRLKLWFLLHFSYTNVCALLLNIKTDENLPVVYNLTYQLQNLYRWIRLNVTLMLVQHQQNIAELSVFVKIIQI